MHSVERVGLLLQHGGITAAAERKPYRWHAAKIREVLDDLQLSIDCEFDDFFIGAVILVHGAANTELEDIVDGHHRLATLSMLRDQIKDRLCSLPRETGTLDKSLRRADGGTGPDLRGRGKQAPAPP
jgi:hypothetical protein